MARSKSVARRIAVQRGSLRVRAYPVLDQCVESGLAYGWNRAHKHTDSPGEDTIREEQHRAIMFAICEAFDVDPERDE